MKTKLRFAFSFVLSAGLFSPQLRAQPLFSDNFDTDHTPNWTVNASAGTHPVNLFFDYGAIGIPSAPNSGFELRPDSKPASGRACRDAAFRS